MPNYSLIFAHTLQDAHDSALLDWHWNHVDELHSEFRRPDTGERARFVQDLPHTLQGLRWNTRVYLGRNWKKRSDASQIMGYLDSGFFLGVDPELPPPRPRSKRSDVLAGIQRTLARLERP